VANILFHCPVPINSSKGNSVCAQRTAAIFERLGQELTFSESSTASKQFDFAIVQHAKRSEQVINSYHGELPIVLVITGTELLVAADDIDASLTKASVIVVTSQQIADELPQRFAEKIRIIPRSVLLPDDYQLYRDDDFRKSNVVAVLGHLRDVKRPATIAAAVRLLAPDSKLVVHHFGAALTPEMESWAINETKTNDRFQWLGEVTRIDALAAMRTSLLTVNSSLVEGGANTIAESIVAGIPVLATPIAGNIGLLGTEYPGYFPIDDATKLAELLTLVEERGDFYESLVSHAAALRPQFHIEQEAEAWRKLTLELLG
jgi:glycosyltransferase involved in cell wall biosynthesis